MAAMVLMSPALARAADPDPYGILLKPIPDKLVVLTFDDACLSHATFVAPLLKKYGFGATFYITMFGRATLDKTQYMSWEQVKGLDDMGFEVGNHSWGHGYLGLGSVESGSRTIAKMEEIFIKNKISKPTTFCWPIYSVCPALFDSMTASGYIFARGGHECAYRPLVDNPFDVSYAVTRRRSSVGVSPTRQRSLQPVAIGAAVAATKPLKSSV